jgi:hypothetical protein
VAEPGSAVPLARKLGVRPGDRIGTIGAPAGFASLLEPMPQGARLVARLDPPPELTVCFAASHAQLERGLARGLRALRADGTLWVAYPKRASGVATDLAFASVQKAGLDVGLVDNKSCAIDETWTALRFVVPLARRAEWARR